METGQMPVLRWLECGAQKEVTSGRTWVNTSTLGEIPGLLKDETSIVIGKTAARGF
jgi:hypothetical protein